MPENPFTNRPQSMIRFLSKRIVFVREIIGNLNRVVQFTPMLLGNGSILALLIIEHRSERQIQTQLWPLLNINTTSTSTTWAWPLQNISKLHASGTPCSVRTHRALRLRFALEQITLFLNNLAFLRLIPFSSNTLQSFDGCCESTESIKIQAAVRE